MHVSLGRSGKERVCQEYLGRVTVFVKLDRVPARFVRVRAKNIGVCPAWHPGNGGAAWIFVDEIQVNPQFKQ